MEANQQNIISEIVLNQVRRYEMTQTETYPYCLDELATFLPPFNVAIYENNNNYHKFGSVCFETDKYYILNHFETKKIIYSDGTTKYKILQPAGTHELINKKNDRLTEFKINYANNGFIEITKTSKKELKDQGLEEDDNNDYDETDDIFDDNMKFINENINKRRREEKILMINDYVEYTHKKTNRTSQGKISKITDKVIFYNNNKNRVNKDLMNINKIKINNI